MGMLLLSLYGLKLVSEVSPHGLKLVCEVSPHGLKLGREDIKFLFT
jgi:dihydroorotase-like cyclic amidohydrolase